jgi:hypothetical protein
MERHWQRQGQAKAMDGRVGPRKETSVDFTCYAPVIPFFKRSGRNTARTRQAVIEGVVVHHQILRARQPWWDSKSQSGCAYNIRARDTRIDMRRYATPSIVGRQSRTARCIASAEHCRSCLYHAFHHHSGQAFLPATLRLARECWNSDTSILSHRPSELRRSVSPESTEPVMVLR